MAASANVAEVGSRVDLLADYSFEVCARDAGELALIRPMVPAGTMISVTYLPNETDEARIATARAVRDAGFEPMPHIAARRIPSVEALDDLLDRLVGDAGVNRLFVIAGDVAAPVGPFVDAGAVIDRLRQSGHGLQVVGISGYPEGHPQIATPQLDQARRDKIASLGEQGITVEIMTQFAFDAGPMLKWLDRLRGEGFAGRVRFGMPGPAHVGTLLRFAARCGVGTSAKVMAKYGTSITRLLHTAGPEKLYADMSHGVAARRDENVSIHLYPFGGLRKMAHWVEAERARAI